MLIKTTQLPPQVAQNLPLPEKSNPHNLFFDIETTGLSADESFLYLIGCAYLDGTELVLQQFMAEDITQEKQLLESFAQLICKDTIFIHFNGSTFDIPYLEKKYAQHNLPSPFTGLAGIDIYKLLKPYKSFLGISSMKQKSLERFAGINRDDIYDGGELIDVYNLFLAVSRFEKLHGTDDFSLKSPSLSSGLPSIKTAAAGKSRDELLEILLLHNYEDVLGMLEIMPLLCVVKFFEGNFSVTGSQTINTSDGPYYKITLKLPQPLPKCAYKCYPFDEMNCVIVTAENTDALLYVPIYGGELRFFFEDYKNYYYLLQEDRAIHKSIGEYVDKEFRKNATATNCYERRSGYYLPASNGHFTPCFYQASKKCAYSFFPIDTLCDEQLHEYAADILQNFVKPVARKHSSPRKTF